MRCHEFQALIEAYLGEEIPEALREPFEEHFFRCRPCFLSLKINESLRNKDVAIALEEGRRPFALRVMRPVLGMAALFLLILASGLLLWQARQAGRLRAISRFDLPFYHEGELRGPREDGPRLEEGFSRAMRAFQARDFRAALQILDQPEFAAAGSPKYDFFRAISLLGTGKAGQAGRILDGIIASMDPAYFDESHYYKGFVLLRQRRPAEARAQFARLAAMLSPMAGKAKEMVQKIDQL
ncbi:MAG TPA: zf-HC2 domain-containing protein [Candidatus Aminicenantes bacterium]|nr:zf-HC2 domain-containing protein [Candidatus Aminicenantes bacterium]